MWSWFQLGRIWCKASEMCLVKASQDHNKKIIIYLFVLNSQINVQFYLSSPHQNDFREHSSSLWFIMTCICVQFKICTTFVPRECQMPPIVMALKQQNYQTVPLGYKKMCADHCKVLCFIFLFVAFEYNVYYFHEINILFVLFPWSMKQWYLRVSYILLTFFRNVCIWDQNSLLFFFCNDLHMVFCTSLKTHRPQEKIANILHMTLKTHFLDEIF